MLEQLADPDRVELPDQPDRSPRGHRLPPGMWSCPGATVPLLTVENTAEWASQSARVQRGRGGRVLRAVGSVGRQRRAPGGAGPFGVRRAGRMGGCAPGTQRLGLPVVHGCDEEWCRILSPDRSDRRTPGRGPRTPGGWRAGPDSQDSIARGAGRRRRATWFVVCGWSCRAAAGPVVGEVTVDDLAGDAKGLGDLVDGVAPLVVVTGLVVLGPRRRRPRWPTAPVGARRCGRERGRRPSLSWCPR